MPGTRLSQNEERLQKAWETERFGAFPLLKRVSVSAPEGRGLRGIRDLSVEFQYPVTFISGTNGSGKSTVLSLAALGFHGVPGHTPTNSRRNSKNGADTFGYYTFQDFFHRGPGDADVSGVQLQWEFSGGASVSISKQSDKWMRYERRPKRPVDFLGLSRAIPAIELPALRNQFGLAATTAIAPLPADAIYHVQRVLARSYQTAEVLNRKRYAIRRGGRDGGYTSFNMGTGEDALIGLIARLHAVPSGALVVIEELESGLHPAAQRRAVNALIEIAWKRKLQVIGSTHSYHVLDQLPRAARVLIGREADSHRVVSMPSAQFALSELGDKAESELVILCEDEFAAGLIAQMLPKTVRRRVSIKSCGSKTELALQAQTYLRLDVRAKCLVLWDGDVSDEEAKEYVRLASARYPHETASQRLSWGRLPGTSCPEEWVLGIARGEGLFQIQEQFRFESEGDARSALEQCGLGDPHDIAHELAELVGLKEDSVAQMLAVCVANTASAECGAVTQQVQAALDGQVIVASQVADETPL